MFYPQSMTKVRLIIPARDLLAVTKAIADLRILHQVDGNQPVPVKTNSPNDTWPEKSTAYASFERRIMSLMQALEISEGQPPSTDRIDFTEMEEIQPVVEQVEREVTRSSEKIAEQHKQIEALQKILDHIEPIADVGVDIDSLREPHYLYSLLGLMPIANIDRLETSLARIPFVLVTLRREEQKAVVWLTGSKRNADILERASRSAYLNPLNLPEAYQGTPSEIIQSIHTDIDQIRQEIDRQHATLTNLRHEQANQLQTLLWQVRTSRILAGAIGQYGQLKYTYIIMGWVPSDKVTYFAQQLKLVSNGLLFETFQYKRGAQQETVPVALHNPRIIRPFQQLVTTYANPRYEEIDPTFLLAFSFPLLFGIMFGDAGQGAFLFLVGILLSSGKIKALRGLASLGGVLAACGLSATIFGVLYGSLFGFENVLPVLLIRPIDSILQILAVAVGAGVVMLSIGFLISIVNAWTRREWGKFLFGFTGIAGLALYWSLIGLAVEVITGKHPVPLIVLALIALMAGLTMTFSELLGRLIEGHRPLVEGGLTIYIAQSFFELFETLISFLSNSISYVRLGAFAVAHAGISIVFFILAALVSPSHGIAYWIVLLIGNIFIIGFEGMIVGIQTMRLEYYEFFSKFFTGGGVGYEPLTLQPIKNK